MKPIDKLLPWALGASATLIVFGLLGAMVLPVKTCTYHVYQSGKQIDTTEERTQGRCPSNHAWEGAYYKLVRIEVTEELDW